MASERNYDAEYKRRRRHPCRDTTCQGKASRAGGYCSYACRNRGEWYRLTPEQRSAKGKAMAKAQWRQAITRMIQRVKVLADREDDRLVLAWRYGLYASKARRYKAKQKGQAA